MTDITVSRELLRQVLNEYEFAFAPTVATKALRAALDAEPAPVQEQQPAPASKPVLLQCMGCERIGTQEQLSTSTDCDCWLHTQPAPVQELVAWWKQYPDGNVSVVEGKVFLTEDALYRGWRPLGFADAAPQAQQPAPVQEPVAFVSPDDLEDMRGPEYAAGAHFRMRKTPAGKYVQPIYTAQPRKAVKLTMHQIAECHPRLYGLDEDMLEFARAIEQAVLKANGVEE